MPLSLSLGKYKCRDELRSSRFGILIGERKIKNGESVYCNNEHLKRAQQYTNLYFFHNNMERRILVRAEWEKKCGHVNNITIPIIYAINIFFY